MQLLGWASARAYLRIHGAQRPDLRRCETSATVVEVELCESALPCREVVVARGAFDPCPQRLVIFGAHDRVAQPALECLAVAHDARRLRPREQWPAVPHSHQRERGLERQLAT